MVRTKDLRITRVSKNRLFVQSLRSLRGRSYALERFLGKAKRKGCKIKRTGYGGEAYTTCPKSIVKLWNTQKFSIGSTKKIRA